MFWIKIILAPLVIGLIVKFFPYKTPVTSGPVDYDELLKKYQKWESFAVVPLFVFLPLMTWLFGQLFTAWFHMTLVKDDHVIFLVLPDKIGWYIPAGILSFGIVGYMMALLYQSLLGPRYDEYILFTNLKHGYDGMKMYGRIAWVMGILAALVLFLMTDYSIKMYPDKLIRNELISLSPKEYTYDQINTIKFVAKRKNKYGAKDDPHYYIKFQDGSAWKTNGGLSAEGQAKQIAEFLSDKSKIRIDSVQFDPRR